MQTVKFKRKYYKSKKRGGSRYGRVRSMVLNLNRDPVSYDIQGCDFCLLGSNNNKQGVPEELLVCTDCKAKAHPSCMDYGPELAARSRLTAWQCINCKTCTVCGDAGDADAMLFCDFCDKGYHMNCHTPQVLDKPTGIWSCQNCHDEITGSHESSIDQDNPEENNNSHQTKSAENGQPNGNGDTFLQNYPSVVPDASKWTIQEVEKFITHVGFPEQATIFRDQEIDGRSLLLMKRNDVLTGLSIHLGPALKIYNHVERLQNFFGKYGPQAVLLNNTNVEGETI